MGSLAAREGERSRGDFEVREKKSVWRKDRWVLVN
ncbi:hypothetical protein AT2G13422 [Arabidopsis thaliana]|uniref:Uncharacterized protein n=1 Tax=Arabidopsis thaliana TaxID=3702 RepID=B3H6U7_ARATH|nr:uncharacterized protein AT2G13422 [Arabidopsis thaliana]AEC06231.1 hypothetical protein AT2G13422 [Arabidopsis thaliana]|eukprot:NP_001118310.1 hypothetical protein AT2G13422 [Arabidopsis thaliana]